MEVSLTDQAVTSALSQNWKEAIRINLTLLDQDHENIEALNRLAFAYLKTGKLKLAKNNYKKVILLDKYNPVAQKHLKLLDSLSKDDIVQENSGMPTPTIFLEEPGKTIVVSLIHPAPTKILCNLMTAQLVQLQPRKRAIEVRTFTGLYIGALPDDLSHRLRILISAGNIFDTHIKNVELNVVSVFIREIKRSKKYAHLPSFSHKLNGKNKSLFILTSHEKLSKKKTKNKKRRKK